MVRQEGYVLNDFAAFWTNTLQECARVQKQSKMRDTSSAHGVAKLTGNKQGANATVNASVKTMAVGRANSRAMKSAENSAMRRARNVKGDAGKVHDDGFPQWLRDMDVAVVSGGKGAQYDFEDFAGCWDSLCSMSKAAASKGSSSSKAHQLSKSHNRSGDQAIAQVSNAKQRSQNHGNHGATSNGSGNQSASATLVPSNAKGMQTKMSNKSGGTERTPASEDNVRQFSMQPRHHVKAHDAKNLTAENGASSAMLISSNRSHTFGKASASVMVNSANHSHNFDKAASDAMLNSSNQGCAMEEILRVLLASSPNASPLHIKQGSSMQNLGDCAHPEDERSIIGSGLASYYKMMSQENAAALKDLANSIVQVYDISNNGRAARAAACCMSQTIRRLDDYILAAGSFQMNSTTIGKRPSCQVDQCTAVRFINAFPGHAARIPGKPSMASAETFIDSQGESRQIVGSGLWMTALRGSVNVGKGGAGGVEMLDRRFDEGSFVINVGIRKYSMFHKP